MTMRLIVGEARTLEFIISDTRHEEFQISQAFFRVSKGSALIDSGLMNIEDKTISFRFTPKTPGLYRLMIQYTIGVDIMKDKYDVEVVDDNL